MCYDLYRPWPLKQNQRSRIKLNLYVLFYPQRDISSKHLKHFPSLAHALSCYSSISLCLLKPIIAPPRCYHCDRAKGRHCHHPFTPVCPCNHHWDFFFFFCSLFLQSMSRMSCQWHPHLRFNVRSLVVNNKKYGLDSLVDFWVWFEDVVHAFALKLGLRYNVFMGDVVIALCGKCWFVASRCSRVGLRETWFFIFALIIKRKR